MVCFSLQVVIAPIQWWAPIHTNCKKWFRRNAGNSRRVQGLKLAALHNRCYRLNVEGLVHWSGLPRDREVLSLGRSAVHFPAEQPPPVPLCAKKHHIWCHSYVQRRD